MLYRILLQKTGLTLFLGLSFYLLHQSTANAAFYKWTDASGQVHYSDEPPTDKSIKPIILDLKTTTITRSKDESSEDDDGDGMESHQDESVEDKGDDAEPEHDEDSGETETDANKTRFTATRNSRVTTT